MQNRIIMCHIFSKSETGIKYDLHGTMFIKDTDLFSKKGSDVFHHILINGIFLHISRSSLNVHHHIRDIMFSDKPCHGIIKCAPGNIIDHICPGRYGHFCY